MAENVEAIKIIPKYTGKFATRKICQYCERKYTPRSCQAYGKICMASEIAVPEHAKRGFERPQRHCNNILDRLGEGQFIHRLGSHASCKPTINPADLWCTKLNTRGLSGKFSAWL